MTVRDLIDHLARFDPDDTVVLASDSEGNAYSPLEYLSGEMNYLPSEWMVGYRELTPELAMLGYDEDDVLTGDDVIPCIVLYP